MEGGEEILQILAGPLRRLLAAAPVSFEALSELRLRIGQPLFLKYRGREYGLTEEGRLLRQAPGGGEGAPLSAGLHIVTAKELRETLEYAGSYSLYAYEEEVRQGFLTVRGGHRVGLSGRAVLENGRVRAIKNISFLNIRIAHQMIGCGDPVEPYLWEEGRLLHTLIISPPGCGKTTLLRDLIRLLSDKRGLTVGVADERSEIAACYQGVPQNRVGKRTDVLDNCPKAAGLSMLIRSMAPEAVAADEIGGADDLHSVREAGQCGCSVLATAHGSSLSELQEKPGFSELFREGFFGRYLLLGRTEEKAAGAILGIYDRKGNRLQTGKKEQQEGSA